MSPHSVSHIPAGEGTGRTEPSPLTPHPYLAQCLYERFVYEAADLARHAARITPQKSETQKTFRADVFEN